MHIQNYCSCQSFTIHVPDERISHIFHLKLLIQAKLVCMLHKFSSFLQQNSKNISLHMHSWNLSMSTEPGKQNLKSDSPVSMAGHWCHRCALGQWNLIFLVITKYITAMSVTATFISRHSIFACVQHTLFELCCKNEENWVDSGCSSWLI